jgi:hypothetical protein
MYIQYLDNDQEADRIIKEYNIDKARYHKQNRDFEYDNFGVDTVVNYVNSVLKYKGLKQIEKNEVEKELSSTNNALMNRINNIIIPKENKRKYEIAKKSMCKDLIANRIKEIEIETERKSGKNWKPSLPIEYILKKVFEISPEVSFA